MKLFRNRRMRKGAALVEYSLLIAGVALIAAAAVSIFGNKTADLIATTAGVLPGAHADDNAPISAGELIETGAGSATNTNGDAGLTLDIDSIANNSGNERLGDNLGFNAGELGELVLEPQ